MRSKPKEVNSCKDAKLVFKTDEEYEEYRKQYREAMGFTKDGKTACPCCRKKVGRWL